MRSRRTTTRIIRTCLLGGALALLFWLKLRVVTGVPRTAIADPKDTPAKAVHPK